MKLKISLFAFVFLLAPAFASAEVYFDGDDRGFGHCSDVGVWNSSTNTCTLNRDLTGYFEINDSGVTLDGNGHTLTGSSQYNSDGVNVYEAGSVTVKNLHITNSSYGVSFYDSPYGIAENNTIESSWGGIYFSTSPSGQIRGNTITGYWSGFGIKGGYSSDHLLVENNTVSGFDENLVLDDSSFGIIRNNTIFGGYCGIEVYRSSDNVFENNTISGSEDSGVYFSDWSTINSYRNIFSQNTIKDSNTGVFSTLVHYNDDGGGSFGSSFAPKKFLDSFFLQNVFAESDDDNLFFKNDFINNDTDVETNSLDYIRFFKLSPDGGNYWDKNTGCVDGNADGFCDAPYVIDTNLNVADNFPRIRKMGDVPTTITGTETEDDGQQDTKGVAGKTKFTFGVSYTGTAPSDVILWANDGNATSHYSLSLENSSYSFTQTFPKGHYSYHYEANGGALRFPASGELSFTAGYSNVAFLPGLEASRLYRLDGTKLWEPGILHDNSQLYLNSDGTSILSGIYADGIIDNVYHLPSKGNIYWSFIGKMNELKTDGTIHDWQPFPYDWRYSVDDTVTTAMMTKFRSLAETSDTGKVTIIAHSNGGLVAKELTIKLGDDAPKLTDQMILVASPQAGTPSAVGAILHGFQQGLPFDNWINQIITPSEARTLANNMPSAYGLLPSANYFTYTDDPVIMFGDYPLLADWREKYGTTIHSEERLRNFMTDQERETLSVNEDLKNPWKGNITLYDKANVLHNVLDTWAPPAGVELTEIAGWGDETLKTIEYYQGSKTGCKEIATLTACHTDPALEYKMQMTIDGDGTVVTSSVLWTRRARKYWVDLDDYNNTRPQSLTHFDRRHADILEVPNLLDFTKKLITRDISTTILATTPEFPPLPIKWKKTSPAANI
ncbi:MAG: right-handed parallel beta-helix repeat-containing protein [Candidatus Parcubacteria bacterium]|nr:right-handed parallel beta-helix repeat-containing protein [Candidatus Parcubacteria bacterium]